MRAREGRSRRDGFSGDSDLWHIDGSDRLVHGHGGVCVALVESDGFCRSQYHHGSDHLAGHVDELCGAEHWPNAVQGVRLHAGPASGPAGCSRYDHHLHSNWDMWSDLVNRWWEMH